MLDISVPTGHPPISSQSSSQTIGSISESLEPQSYSNTYGDGPLKRACKTSLEE